MASQISQPPVLHSAFFLVSLDVLFAHPAVWVSGAIAILIAIAVHEFAHAAVASALGDATAREGGRLTLNPLAHVDPFGLLMLLLVGFGWGKPVPFDPSRLRFPRWGPVAIAFAGPLANLVLLIVAGLLLGVVERGRFLPSNNLFVLFLAFSFQFNLVLLLFNLIPIPPLDGSKLLLSVLDHPRFDGVRFLLATRGSIFLLVLIIADAFTGGALLARPFHAALRWVASIF